MAKKKKHKQRRANPLLINTLLARMTVTGYMKFSLDSANDPELFSHTVECTGDFADPNRRSYILGTPHYYKFTITLCNYGGVILNENDYFVAQLIDHSEFEQVIRQFVSEQAQEIGNDNIINGKHSTVKLSVYNPNTKEHL